MYTGGNPWYTPILHLTLPYTDTQALINVDTVNIDGLLVNLIKATRAHKNGVWGIKE